MSIVSMLEQHNAISNNLSAKTTSFRYRVARAFLAAGISFNKLTDDIRKLLEESGNRLGDRGFLSAMIPIIAAEERESIKSEIRGQDVSVMFDASSHVCEVFAVVLRFTKNMVIHQRLAAIRLLKQSMTADQCAAELIQLLTVDLGICFKNIVGISHDRCSVNTAAMETLSRLMPRMKDIGCLSHLLNTVGTKFETPTLDEFVSLWVQLHSKSFKTRELWKTFAGKYPKRPSPTRWWSTWEVIAELQENIESIEPFINECKYSPKVIAKMKGLYAGHAPIIKLQMAAAFDAGKPLVQATYKLEGDGFLAQLVYTLMKGVENHLNQF